MTWPVNNAGWWRAKIARTRARDRETDDLLAAEGWTVMRVWEHEEPRVAAERLRNLVRASRTAAPRDRQRP